MLSLYAFFALFAAVQGADFVSNTLGSNMVLQRAPQKAVIWGWTAKPGATVNCNFNGKKYQTTSGSDSSYSFALDPTPAGGPYTITLASTAGDVATLSNVMFGDVWLCSGQSNMQMTVDSVFNWTQEVQKAANYPNIRLFTVGQGTVSLTPLAELASIEQTWVGASPNSVGGGNWTEFSAACWFFGRNLFDSLQVPIGLVSTNWGGTYIQAWSSPTALSKCNQSSVAEIPYDHKSSKTFVRKSLPRANPNQPSVLWNAMIVPYLNMRVKGAIWYQGEANVGTGNADPYYACAFPAMIKDWRLNWGLAPQDFGFFFVQLAPWTQPIMPATSLQDMRLAQTAALKEPFVCMGTAADLGDVTSPFDNIHPRDKQDVGFRLALCGLGLSYDQNVQYLGPTFVAMNVVRGPPNVQVQIEFDPVSIGSGLQLNTAQCPQGVPPNLCVGAEIGLSDGTWVAATESISSGNYYFSASSVKSSLKVTGVRYGYSIWPLISLYNKEGLPSPPYLKTSS